MQEQSSVFGGPATSLELRYTGKPVSGWGGLVAVMRYLERRGVRRGFGGGRPHGPPPPHPISGGGNVVGFFSGCFPGVGAFRPSIRLAPVRGGGRSLGRGRGP